LDGKAEYVSGDGGIGAGRWARSISRDRVATLAGQVLCPRVGVDLAIGGCALLMPPDVIAALRALRTRQQDEATALGRSWSADRLVAVREDGQAVRPGWYSADFHQRQSHARSGPPAAHRRRMARPRPRRHAVDLRRRQSRRTAHSRRVAVHLTRAHWITDAIVLGLGTLRGHWTASRTKRRLPISRKPPLNCMFTVGLTGFEPATP
jgi:hypothetical protein